MAFNPNPNWGSVPSIVPIMYDRVIKMQAQSRKGPLPDTPLRVVICSPQVSGQKGPLDSLRFSLQMTVPEVYEETVLDWLVVQLDLIGGMWGYRDCTVRIRGVKGGMFLFWDRSMVMEKGVPSLGLKPDR